ncbi:MAG TPA: fibronectin type III domain-containing protein [Solirubrobacteraceae bacterium]|nr:fibronectin type III domain-containing protein [Solirubrobacteraceae bacterium]
MLGMVSTASAVTPVIVPAGGDFEATPLSYSTRTTCGLLCTLTVSRQQEGANHYLHSEYESLLGLLGTNTGTATITSPQFTWTKATPNAVTFAFERRDSLGESLGLNSGVEFTATLVDDSAATSTAILTEALAPEAAFTAHSVPVPAADIADGHTYHLVVTETFHTLLGLATVATVDLDNVGLAITPAATAPSIGSTSLGTPGERSVTGTATIDPHGEETTYAIQYGTTASYGSETTVQTIPAGQEGLQQVTSALSGLTPGTNYHARFVVKSAGGTTFGNDMTFATAPPSQPTVGTATVGSITSTGAIVSDTVDPGQNATSVVVEYGPTTSYGQTTSAVNLPAGGGSTSVQIPLSGLTASTTYHVRVVATNADGTQPSADVSFTTGSGGGGTGAPTIGATNVTTLGERLATLSTGADPHGEAATYEVEYGLSTAYGATTAAQPIASGSSGAQPLSVQVNGLAPSTTYHARYVVSSGGGTSHGLDVTFTTAAPQAPQVGGASVGSITAGSATVKASVDPGQNVTSVEVEYGPTTAYGHTTAVQGIGAGGGATPLQFPLAGLAANTTYHARVLATSADGTTESQDLTFMTSSGGNEGEKGGGTGPDVTGSSADGLTEHGAVLHATINPHGQETGYEVQYGTSTGYGSATTVKLLGAGTSGGTAVAIPLLGLQAGTNYHARFRAVSSAGTAEGGDVAFTTRAAGSETPENGSNPNGKGGSGGESGTGSSTSTTNGATSGASAGSGVASCLRVQAKRRGPAAKLLSVATLQQISAARPLQVALTKAAGKKTKLRYSIAGAPYVSTTSRLVKLAPAQLKGTNTAVRFQLSAAHRRTRSLRIVLSATPCGVVLGVKRVGSQLQVTVSRLTRSQDVLLTLPRSLAAPNRLTLLTTTKNHAYRLRGTRAIRLAPKAKSPVVHRSSGALSVSRLTDQVTGLVLRFPAKQPLSGAIKARVTSAGGAVQAATASVR